MMSFRDAKSHVILAWARGLSEWQGNARLRLGMVLIVGLLLLVGLLELRDRARQWENQVEALKKQASVLRALKAQSNWAQRASDAKQMLLVAEGLRWRMASQGTAEARLQDEVRALAEQAGLKVLDMTVLPSATLPGAPSGASQLSTARNTVLRIRVSTEFARLPLMSFLGEVQGTTPRVMVDALTIKTAPPPGRVEVELRMQLQLEGAGV